jgi:hypothetical protein
MITKPMPAASAADDTPRARARCQRSRSDSSRTPCLASSHRHPRTCIQHCANNKQIQTIHQHNERTETDDDDDNKELRCAAGERFDVASICRSAQQQAVRITVLFSGVTTTTPVTTQTLKTKTGVHRTCRIACRSLSAAAACTARSSRCSWCPVARRVRWPARRTRAISL